MENIDYEQAKQQLISKFNKDIGHRHIIFWYDSSKIFFENVKNDTFDNAKIIIYENNPFTIKTILEIDDVKSNYLVYYPFDKPNDVDNWLLDIALYSEEYYADIVALTMNKLNLTSNNLRRIIEQHIQFFNAQARIESLNKVITINDNMLPLELELGMMSVLVKNNNYNRIEFILNEIIYDELENKEKYKLLEKYEFKDIFWNLVCEKFSYSGVQSVKELYYSFLITAMIKKTNIDVKTPIIRNKLINENTEELEIFVDQILSNDKRYIELDKSVWNDLKINELISKTNFLDIKSCDTFKEIDEVIINSIINLLVSGSCDYEVYAKFINGKRINSKWYDEYRLTYEFIIKLINFYMIINIEIETNLKADDYIDNYCKQYWQIDNAYRHVISVYSKINDISDEMIRLINDVDNQYESKFLNKLGYEFSKSLKGIEPNYSFNSTRLSKDFFKYNVSGGNKKKQFIIISDALRYEVGEDLVKAINLKDNFKGKASINYQITTIPSITMFGMASLLPNKEITYNDKQVFVDGMPTKTTKDRDNILKSYYKEFSAIRYDDIQAMNRDELRNYMKDKNGVYLYHNTIDNAGEHNETTVFSACEEAINQIVSLIMKLYNTLQISNYIITSDHGFIYRNKKIEESSKYNNIASLGFNDYSQRYIITGNQVDVEYINKFNMNYLNNCQSSVIVPYGYDLFKKSGGGIQYIHGGASLQEIITPIIVLSEMRSQASGRGAESVKVRLKSSMRKIMNKSFSLTFEQCEKVENKKIEAHIKVYFIDENQNVISDEKYFVANKATDNLDDRTIEIRFLLKNLTYDRNKKYYLVIKNADTDEILETEIPFIIDIVGFKLF